MSVYIAVFPPPSPKPYFLRKAPVSRQVFSIQFGSLQQIYFVLVWKMDRSIDTKYTDTKTVGYTFGKAYLKAQGTRASVQ